MAKSKASPKRYAKDTVLTLTIMAVAFGLSFILGDVLDISEHITTLFAFAVFLVSLLTEGFLFGVLSTFASVIIINYAFTYPYFGMDFSVPENIFSAVVMLVISLLTSTFTTKLKLWQELKAEGERERMRANLLRAVSHDLRTPLTTIYGASSSVLENYDKLTEEQKLRMAQSIKEDSEWLIRMVENLLSVTRIDSGKLKISKTPIVLEELIDSVILKFKKRYPDRRVELSLPEELVLIPMDALLIEQVMMNLLENAVHHAKNMTRISVAVRVQSDEAVFEISDDGCGFERDTVDKIFKGYGGLLENHDTDRRNAGIGLSVCATIIKAHGGKICAENAVSGGAIFRFSLPMREKNNE